MEVEIEFKHNLTFQSFVLSHFVSLPYLRFSVFNYGQGFLSGFFGYDEVGQILTLPLTEFNSVRHFFARAFNFPG